MSRCIVIPKGVDQVKKVLEKVPGVALSAGIAIPAWLLGKCFPIVGGPVMGILFGMILAFWKRPAFFQNGISYASRNLLQYSIILLGFDMNLFHVFKVGGQTIVLMAFTLTAAFLSAFFLGKALKVDQNTNILVGVGTAICGGSAIAAAAPVIHADDQDVAQSISTIFLFNVIAAFLFPFLGHMLHMSDYNFGLWAGTAVNDTSSVVAAGYAFSNAAGNLAVIVKLTRTLMIVPVTLALAFFVSGRQRKQGESHYHFAKIFPWFVLGFAAASVTSTFLPLPEETGTFLAQVGKFVIVMAMSAIGLNTNIVKLVKNGYRPILLGLGCWLVLAATSLVVQYAVLRV